MLVDFKDPIGEVKQFWGQLLVHLAPVQDKWIIMYNQEGSTASKGDTMYITKTVTVVLVTDSLADFDWKQLDFGVRYARSVRFRVAVMEDFGNSSNAEVLAHAKAIIEKRCTSSNLRFITINSFYIVARRMWIRTYAYPDERKVCSVGAINVEDLPRVDNEAVKGIRNFKRHNITIATLEYPPFVIFPKPGIPEPAEDIGGAEFKMLKRVCILWRELS